MRSGKVGVVGFENVPSGTLRTHLGRPLFFFNDTATTEIYTLSLHDALPISSHVAETTGACHYAQLIFGIFLYVDSRGVTAKRDRKSTRLNSSHVRISYAAFCLKKKRSSE